jgi:hypothetical protein
VRRARRAAALLGLAFLAACGSDSPTDPDDDPTIGTPIPPSTAPVVGAYTLSVLPDPSCGLPVGPHSVAVQAAAAGTASRPELRVTLPGGDTTLTMEMLYESPGRLHGSIGTIAPVAVGGGLSLFVRGVGEAEVSQAGGGRGEIADGRLVGDVELLRGAASLGTCPSVSHRFALRAR